jgi:hypothetical protein
MQTGMAVAGIVGVVLHAIARKGMQAEGHVEVLRRRPERLVAALLVAVALRGIGDDHGAFETQGRTALEFLHRQGYVPHRKQTEAEQTRRRIGAVLGEQVVVDPEELSLQRGIRDRHQTQGIGGIQYLGNGPVQRHVLQPGRRIIGAWQALLVPGLSEMVGNFVVTLAAR